LLGFGAVSGAAGLPVVSARGISVETVADEALLSGYLTLLILKEVGEWTKDTPVEVVGVATS
jgi:hypothetical protein